MRFLPRMAYRVAVIFTVIMATTFSISGQSQVVTGHYGPGLFGMRSAHGFPTDWSVANVTHFYYAGEYKDNDGRISTLGKPVNIIANISAGMWGTEIEQFNIKYNGILVLPFTNLAPNPETLELDPDKIGLGDIMAIPIMLTWSHDWIIVNARYGIWAPTGRFQNGAKNNRGKGFWSHNIGLGGTLYFDKERTWSVSTMNTFEFNSTQEGSSIKAAPSYVLEWGIGKTFDKVFNVGLIGYFNSQIGNQQGGNIPDNTRMSRVQSEGMEFSYRTKNKWIFITRWYIEHSGVNRTEGTAIRFIVLKNF